jgi:hypothetical protein
MICLEEGVGPCDNDPGSGNRCRYVAGACETYRGFCINFAPTTVLSEWTVASVEVSHPAKDAIAKVVTAPAAVAQADAPPHAAQN